MSPRWIREMLTGEFYRDLQHPHERVPYARFPVQDVMERVAERFQAEREYWQARIAPIRKHAKVDDHYITGADEHRVFDPPTDSERHAARRLGVEVPILKCTALTFLITGISMRNVTAGSAMSMNWRRAAGRHAGVS